MDEAESGIMKVTVTFGQMGIVVPCKDGWTVRDLIQQATQRYRKLLEQEGDYLVRTHHVEYCDGGILDPDDTLSDLVEDRDKLMAVFEEHEAQQRSGTNTSVSPSPELYQTELSAFQPIAGGEIEVTSSALKSNTPLLVRSSSDSALSPQSTEIESSLTEDTTPMGASPVVERPMAADRSYGIHTLNAGLTRTVEILVEDSPLGIHVVPYCSSLSGRPLGLYIRGVEEESRTRKEGLFQEDECIVKINNSDLMDKTFSQSQEVFRQAMRSPLVRLEVVPSSNKERFEKSLIGQLFNSGPESSPRIPKTKDPPPPVKAKPVFKPPETPSMRLTEDPALLEAPVSTLKGRSESPLMRKSPGLSSLASNKRGGRRLRIDLKKGSEGLGFTVVTRDSSVHGPGPILVKNILPRGAAVKDGRLQSGDRILEVNGVDITGVGQEELVSMLRSTQQGGSVSLVVLRQEDMFLPREMKEDVPRGPLLISESGKEQLMFEVPLNDTGSAGLGVSLKGNKSRETGEDLGIFIKSIIHGGAAYKDGRLHVNDQLVAVNGESLLGRSNHMAMETLRRSMSQEGNVRGTIQLVVFRTLTDHPGVSPNPSFDSSLGLMSPVNGHGQSNGLAHPSLVNNMLYGSHVANGSYSHMDEEEEGEMYGHEATFSSSLQHSYLHESFRENLNQVLQNPTQRQFQHVKASKSMDLGTTQTRQHTVEDESNVGSLTGDTAVPATPMELGPTLGLKKSSSLESLQTAVSEVNRKNELLPFHRPRANMVRGRGCNESFRAAIDKSYDGPPEDDDDDGSEPSSGRDSPRSSSSRQGTGDQPEEKSKKDKKKKPKPKKKEKNKAKEKEKDKKKTEEPEDTEKKSKKIGFGLLRFGKKKDEKKEAKAALQRQKSDLLTDVELEKMKEERERIESSHPELRPRDQQSNAAYPDVEDDDMDPNYARIQTFRDRTMPSPSQAMSQSPLYNTVQHPSARTPSPHAPPPFPGHRSNGTDPGAAPDDDHIDGLYAKVNKPRGGGATSPAAPAPASDSSVDRIQQLRREYKQARREGMVPPYEELDLRRRVHDNDPHRMPGRDPRMAPRYEEVERQYASLPRRGPMNPAEYPMQQQQQPWSGHYPGPPQAPHAYPQAPSYPNPSSQSAAPYSYTAGPPYTRDPRVVEPGYYTHPSSQQRGPLRQDVPPSPTPPLRGLRYETMSRGAVGGGGYR